jgi:hypothetical protein
VTTVTSTRERGDSDPTVIVTDSDRKLGPASRRAYGGG